MIKALNCDFLRNNLRTVLIYLLMYLENNGISHLLRNRIVSMKSDLFDKLLLWHSDNTTDIRNEGVNAQSRDLKILP